MDNSNLRCVKFRGRASTCINNCLYISPVFQTCLTLSVDIVSDSAALQNFSCSTYEK